MQDKFGLPLVLIVIDTVIAGAGFYKEGQESDAVSGQLVMNTMNNVAKALGCFVLGVDHFGKAVETGTRGTSAKEAAADVIIAMLGDRAITGAVSNTRLAMRKRRSGHAGEEYAFTARVVDMGEDDHGRPLTSMVLDWADAPPTIVTSMSDNKAKSNRLLMRVLETLVVDHGVPHTPFADGPTVRAIKLELLEAEFIRQYATTAAKDSKRRQFDRAVKAAQNSGQIASRDDGLGHQWVWVANEQNAIFPTGCGGADNPDSPGHPLGVCPDCPDCPNPRPGPSGQLGHCPKCPKCPDWESPGEDGARFWFSDGECVSA